MKHHAYPIYPRKRSLLSLVGRVLAVLAGCGVTWFAGYALVAWLVRGDVVLLMFGVGLLAIGYSLVRLGMVGTR